MLRDCAVAFACLGVAVGAGPDDRFTGLSRAVTEFKLANGAQFFVVERPQSPVVSFHLRIRAGYADDPAGKGGLAHLALRTFLEGTEIYGSKNPAAEKAALAEAARFLVSARAEQSKGEKTDDVAKGRSETQMIEALNRASVHAQVEHFFEKVLIQNGAADPVLRPSLDHSDIAVTLPSHRAELWFRMAGGWLQAPSTRLFYENRLLFLDRRQPQNKQPARAQREFALASAFLVHPYQAVRSIDNDIASIYDDDVREFIKAYYVPANVTVAIVGDIAAADAKRLAESYFGKIPAKSPPPVQSVELARLNRSDRIRLAVPEAPVFAAGWPRPEGAHPDDPVFDILQAVMTGGPGSRMHGELQGGTPVVSRIEATSRFPGGRFPGLFVIEVDPLPTSSIDEAEVALLRVVNGMAKELVSAEELERARMWWRSRLLEEARSAAGRAHQLARAHTEYGSYRIEARLAKLDAVTAADCQRVLRQYLADHPYVPVHQLTMVEGVEVQEAQ